MITSVRLLMTGLALLVALTAQGAAMARGMPGPAGHLVLCTGTGPVMVYVDEDGQPTAAPHICPDYALSLVLALDVPDADVVRVSDWTRIVHSEMRDEVRGVSFGSPRARGPPGLI